MEKTVAAQSLNEIVKYNVRALIRRFHLNPDYIIGLTGDRGSGKSMGGANIAIRDFMMNEEPCHSNMHIKLNVEVEEAVAWSYGLDTGGTVTYESQYLQKSMFYRMDERYRGGVKFFDEFNLEGGEARRSSSNANLRTDRGIQLLRKLESGLVYTVINEMYCDLRIRENTDIFIKCLDVALKPENMRAHMPQGHVFEWLLYPMTAKVAGVGNTYDETHTPIGPFQITLRGLWNSFDTFESPEDREAEETMVKELIPVEMREDPVVVQEHNKWGWLDDAISRFYDNHANDGEMIDIRSDDLRQELGVRKEHWPNVVKKVRERIQDIESRGSGNSVSPLRYRIPQRLLRL